MLNVIMLSVVMLSVVVRIVWVPTVKLISISWGEAIVNCRSTKTELVFEKWETATEKWLDSLKIGKKLKNLKLFKSFFFGKNLNWFLRKTPTIFFPCCCSRQIRYSVCSWQTFPTKSTLPTLVGATDGLDLAKKPYYGQTLKLIFVKDSSIFFPSCHSGQIRYSVCSCQTFPQ